MSQAEARSEDGALTYVYCLLPAGARVDTEGVGAMDSRWPLRLLSAGPLQAAVSHVGAEFEADRLNAAVQDIEWLSPRALCHHDVVDSLYRQCPDVLPLAFGVIFQSDASFLGRLLADQDRFVALLDTLRGREEWDLKLARDASIFAAALARESAPLRELTAELAGKPPGTAFMLKKKLERLGVDEARAVSLGIREDVHRRLSAVAVASQVEDLAIAGRPRPTALELRSAYLVERGASAALHREAEALAGRYGPSGYVFDLSGPWPAFSFTGGVRQALA
ncbi:MAG: GvpL/GvpF family gas vesicle protein [Chloroflexota bacterium]